MKGACESGVFNHVESQLRSFSGVFRWRIELTQTHSFRIPIPDRGFMNTLKTIFLLSLSFVLNASYSQADILSCTGNSSKGTYVIWVDTQLKELIATRDGAPLVEFKKSEFKTYQYRMKSVMLGENTFNRVSLGFEADQFKDLTQYVAQLEISLQGGKELDSLQIPCQFRSLTCQRAAE